ncbi:kinetochore-associated Ndc80 complex subunit spc25 [Cryptotrichosporon argae]
MPATAYLPPQSISLRETLENLNVASQGPALDLEWEPFHTHVEAFLNAIDQYTLAAKTEIAARATDHTALVRDIQAEKKETERRIQVERERETEMLATLEAERHTLADLTSSLSRLQNSLSRVREQSTSLDSELGAVRKEALAERATKERQRAALGEMHEMDSAESARMEAALGWKIAGIQPNVLMMTFTLLDPSDPDREFQFVIDVSQQDYTVPNCAPPLPELPELLQQLNVDRDFLGFSKKVRKAFRALVTPPPAQPSKFDDLAGPGTRAAAVEEAA